MHLIFQKTPILTHFWHLIPLIIFCLLTFFNFLTLFCDNRQICNFLLWFLKLSFRKGTSDWGHQLRITLMLLFLNLKDLFVNYLTYILALLFIVGKILTYYTFFIHYLPKFARTFMFSPFAAFWQKLANLGRFTAQSRNFLPNFFIELHFIFTWPVYNLYDGF